MSADVTYPSSIQLRQNGNGAVPSGKTLDIESGGKLTIAGTEVQAELAASVAGLLATTAEINRVCDRSTRSIAAGATLTLTEAAHDGKTILLDTAAGSVVTLPAPVIGMRVRFWVSVKPTSNFHQIKVAAGTDFLAGVANIDRKSVV